MNRDAHEFFPGILLPIWAGALIHEYEKWPGKYPSAVARGMVEEKERFAIRVRSRISSQIVGVAAPGWQGAKVQKYPEYAELSQRSQASMQRRLKCEVIFACALSLKT